ncbi:MAG TPA: hypothetical protein VHE33_08650 [Acidobacteriaceae bacterium]|nr:hypothetical protein [Acidobacteriaceae bacterium]
MKKLAIASIALATFAAGAISLPALAQGADGQATAQPAGQTGGANCGQITIKDAAEYNAYANATSQSDPAAKASAIESFLQQYPNSVAKNEMLQGLMAAYQAAGNAPKMLDAAKRLIAADPNNLRAMLAVVYLQNMQANQPANAANKQQMLDEAAATAQKGLSATKDACMSQADYDKVKDLATPTFYSAIGAAAMAKKDTKAEIDAYTNELKSYKDPNQTTSGPALVDTYNLGNAYLNLDPKDIKNAVWFLTRAAQFAQANFKKPIQDAAEYWYKKYHCAQNDAACNATPPQGFAQVQQLAGVPANIFPPADYNPTQAPPPPSPADLAHQAVVTSAGCAGVTPAPPPSAPATGAGAAATPAAAPETAPAAAPATPAASAPAPSLPAACTTSLKNMALSDKEFILANGQQADQAAIWSVMNGVTAEIPGKVISATPDSIQLAVTQDAQQSNNADFTVNMKTPLKEKELPATGTTVTLIATFDSYTPKMIILKDGAPKASPKAPVHHAAPAHRSAARPH